MLTSAFCTLFFSPFRVETRNAPSAVWEFGSVHLFLYFVTTQALSSVKVVLQHVRNYSPAKDFRLFGGFLSLPLCLSLSLSFFFLFFFVEAQGFQMSRVVNVRDCVRMNYHTTHPFSVPWAKNL